MPSTMSETEQFISAVRYVSKAYGPHEPNFWRRLALQLYPAKGGKDQTRRRQVLKRWRDRFRRDSKFQNRITKEFERVNLSPITGHETHESAEDGETWYGEEGATNSEGKDHIIQAGLKESCHSYERVMLAHKERASASAYIGHTNSETSSRDDNAKVQECNGSVQENKTSGLKSKGRSLGDSDSDLTDDEPGHDYDHGQEINELMPRSENSDADWEEGDSGHYCDNRRHIDNLETTDSGPDCEDSDPVRQNYHRPDVKHQKQEDTNTDWKDSSIGVGGTTADRSNICDDEDKNHQRGMHQNQSTGDNPETSNPGQSGNSSEERSTCFRITSQEWEQMTQENKMVKHKWSDLLYEAFRRSTDSVCPLVFVYSHLKKQGSRKTSAPDFSAKARCKFENCQMFHFTIEEVRPDGCQQVQCVITGTKKHQGSTGRWLRGGRREDAAKMTSLQGAFKTQMDMLRKAPEAELHEGNRTTVPSRDVLRRAAVERKAKERLSTNWAEDLLLAKAVLKETDMCSVKLLGPIQSFSLDPLSVHVYTEFFLKMYQREPTTLHIDATGAITHRKGDKEPYYYAVTAETRTGSYPLAHMISETHHVPALTHFLSMVFYDMKKSTTKEVHPPRVVTDFSWALMHASCSVFQQKTLPEYLDICWESVVGEAEVPPTVLSLCKSHMSHEISRASRRHGMKDRESHRAIMWLWSEMVRAQKLRDMDKAFTKLMTLLLSKKRVCEVAAKVKAATEEKDRPDFIHPRAGKPTYRRNTPFGQHFDALKQKVQNTVTQESEDDTGEKNQLHCPALAEYLVTTVMPLAPLWSQLLAQEATSNAWSESWFRTMKHCILSSKRRISPGDFVREIIKSSLARQKELMIPEGKPGGRKRKKEPEKVETDSDVEEETPPNRDTGTQETPCATEKWKKRTAKGKKRRTYLEQYEPPKTVQDLNTSTESQSGVKYRDISPITISDIDIDDETQQQSKVDIPEPCSSDEGSTELLIGNVVLPRSMPSLQNGKWLDDLVIDAYLLTIAAETDGRVLSFLSCTLPTMAKVMPSHGLSANLEQQRTTKADIWLIPHNENDCHWVLYVVDHTAKTISYHNSLKPEKKPPRERPVQDIQALIQCGRGPTSWRDWRLLLTDTPQQHDGSSCGLFVCLSAYTAAGGRSRELESPEGYRLEIRRVIKQVRTYLEEFK